MTKRLRPVQDRAGVTLLELLLVVFIIGILMMIFLPAFSQAKARSRQVDCLSQLRQVGLAHHAFAHDHNGHFPFQVSVREGGTLELAQGPAQFGGDLQTTYQHFRALSNELLTPKVLLCPADKRMRTDSFAELNNENLSYFVAVTADYNRPETILSGDRNLRLNGDSSQSVMRFNPSSMVTWTGELHEYRGNLLFADGHAEKREGATLQSAFTDNFTRVTAFVPVDPNAPSGSAGKGASASGNSAANNGNGNGSGSSPLDAFFQSASRKPGDYSTPSGSSASPSSAPSTSPDSRRSRSDPSRVPRNSGQDSSPRIPSPSGSPKESNRLQSAVAAKPLPSEVSPTGAPAEPATVAPNSALSTIVAGPQGNWWWVILIAIVAGGTMIGLLLERHFQRRRLRSAMPRRRLAYGVLAERRRGRR